MGAEYLYLGRVNFTQKSCDSNDPKYTAIFEINFLFNIYRFSCAQFATLLSRIRDWMPSVATSKSSTKPSPELNARFESRNWS